MRKLFLMAGACFAVFFSGCSDDDIVKGGIRPVSGNEVVFGASTGVFTKDGPKTRTVYGVEEGENYQNYTTLTVHWIKDDQIRIYSPEAAEGYKSANYEVSPSHTADSYLIKVKDTGIRWGDTSKEHNFYAFYPNNVSRINMTGLETESKVKATIPVAQEHGELLRFTNDGKEDPNGTWLTIAPDMNFAMMTAKTQYIPGQGTNGTIALEFKPIVTMLDVVVNSGETTYKIIGVQVKSKTQPIVGDFTYNYEGGENGEGAFEDIKGTNQAYVDCMDEGSALELKAGEKLNVKFFLLPQDIKASELSVSVVLEGNRVITKSLVEEGSGSSDVTFLQGNIIKIQTPKIKVGEESNWMSLIESDVYFASQLSLPGSKYAFSYRYLDEDGAANDKGTNPKGITIGDLQNPVITSSKLTNNQGVNHWRQYFYQTLNIENQFKAGIRAFHLKLDIEGHNYYNEAVMQVTIDQLLTELQGLLDKNPTEGVIVTVDYVGGGGTPQDWVTTLANKIDAWKGATTHLRKLTEETTMGDMRGRIAVVLHAPGEESCTSPNICVVQGYSSSVQQRKIVENNFGTGGKLYTQTLQQVNNPEITDETIDGYSAGCGLVPYFMFRAHQVDKEPITNFKLIEKKQELISELFTLSYNNAMLPETQKINNFYLNDLSGWCVVRDRLSTGWGTFDIQEWTRRGILGREEWSETRNGEAIDPTNKNVFTYNYIDLKGADAPDGELGDTWCVRRTDDEKSDGYSRGEGGNQAKFAAEINPYATRVIRDLVNQGRMPLGIVYMNFVGVSTVTIKGGDDNRRYEVGGVNLPSYIVSNNFKFPLVKK